MKLKKTIRTLHRWLGLITGLPFFLIALTGSLYAFQEEIQDFGRQDYKIENSGLIPRKPSEVQKVAERLIPEKTLHAVLYPKTGKAAEAIFYERGQEYYEKVYIHPENLEILGHEDLTKGFFPFVLQGHYYLWLPPKIGHPFVAIVCLVFLFIGLSGLFIWWPKNKKARKQRFTIKWKSVNWKRKNYDLHQVLGFYLLIFAMVFSITGLVWGFDWFRNSYYAISSGGESFQEFEMPLPENPGDSLSQAHAMDQVFYRMWREYPKAEYIEVHPAIDSLGTIAANANPDASTYWKTDYRYFEPHHLKELEVNHIWGRFENAGFADKLMRMNYDIHVGAIGGLPGKILAFLVSLILASLPITGFLIWYGRKIKARKKTKQKDFLRPKAWLLRSS